MVELALHAELGQQVRLVVGGAQDMMRNAKATLLDAATFAPLGAVVGGAAVHVGHFGFGQGVCEGDEKIAVGFWP